MKLKKWLHATVIAGVLVIPLTLSGCGFLTKSTPEQIDPPQDEETIEQETSLMEQVEGSHSYIVYLQDRNGYLAPISLPVVIGEQEEVGQKLLELMVDHGLYAALMPEDFRALIPQGTEILGYEFNEETQIATVNFSEPFINYNAADERAIIESIVYTLTSLDGVKGVSIEVNGDPLYEMPVAGYPLASILDRSIGINIELAEGVNHSHSTPVTVYFSAETIDAEQYFVPITRMIDRKDTKVVAALEELIAGPQNKKDLSPVIMSDVTVMGYEIYDDIAHLDLQDESYEPGEFVPSEMLQAVILSVIDNSGVQAVQIRMNGDINIFDEKNQSYSEPVSMPEKVNALKL